MKIPGRNDPCPCGSGKKSGQCCMQLEKARLTVAHTEEVSIPTALQLAVEHHKAGRFPQAKAIYQKILQVEPNDPDALQLSGVIAHQTEEDEIAVEYIDKAIRARPSNPAFHCNMGNALRGLNKLDEAVASFNKAILLQPDFADAYNNLGMALQNQRKLDEAESAFRRAIALVPDAAKPHNNLGYCLLAKAQFREGWDEYEWRIDAMADDYEKKLRGKSLPASLREWNGEPLTGRALVLVTEQGQGDAIQFIRYASILARAGAQVHIACLPTLVRLFHTVEGVAHVFSTYDGNSQFDYRCWLMSLPRLLGTQLASIPASIPYLKAEAGVIERWRIKLDAIRGLKVGLVWAGGLRDDHELRRLGKKRDVPLSLLATLATITDVTLISLQKKDGSSTALATEETTGVPMIDMTAELHDFADTAALIENLDLVISADTAVAHLAGALGKPVWLLSRYDGCWRWLEPRTDSPWYPSMKIFWQSQPGDWAEPIARVKQELQVMAKIAGRQQQFPS